MIGPNYFVMNIHIYYKHFLIGQIADSTLSQIPNKISTKTLPFFKVTKTSDTLKELTVWQKRRNSISLLSMITVSTTRRVLWFHILILLWGTCLSVLRVSFSIVPANNSYINSAHAIKKLAAGLEAKKIVQNLVPTLFSVSNNRSSTLKDGGHRLNRCIKIQK